MILQSSVYSCFVVQIVGWYSTGSLVPNSGEETIARLINDMKEASLFLKVDPFKSDRSTNELPMALFELETNGGLIQKSFNLEAKDAERVSPPPFPNSILISLSDRSRRLSGRRFSRARIWRSDSTLSPCPDITTILKRCRNRRSSSRWRNHSTRTVVTVTTS